MSAPFEEFGPYAVYERLGQGGMATVHRAEKRGVGIRRPIALKRLLPHVAADPGLVKLFVDEARLASHLHHANVAQTYELGKVGDIFFIAMEYASGPTLAQIIRQCQQAAGEIPLTVTVNILSQVCEALDYAHNLCDETGRALRIIHRDVSPANIIVTNTGVVKLIDFGIAKATISSVKTQTGFIKGKFGYIAPEYITGKIDARVDLFAVGVVAHEMLAGRRLFEGKDDFETLQNIREMNPQPPSRWNPHVTADLDDIVMTALQRDPASRWQSAGAMQVALAQVARAFGLVVGGQQLAEWVDWAFSQVPPDSGRVTIPGAGDSDGFPSGGDSDGFPSGGPSAGSSLSIEISRASASALEVTPPPETPPPQLTPPPERARPARRRPSSEFDETVPLERIELSRRDIEMLTPSPVIEPPPPAVPPSPRLPRSSRTQDAVAAPSPWPAEASSVPPPIPPPRSADPSPAPPPIPPPRSADPSPAPPPIPPPIPPPRSAAATAMPPPIPPPRSADASAVPPPVASSRELEVPAPAPAPAKPTPARDVHIRPARRSRRNAWLILLMIVLGGGAMAAAYYWPDLASYWPDL